MSNNKLHKIFNKGDDFWSQKPNADSFDRLERMLDKKRSPQKKWWALAASLTVLLIASYYMMDFNDNESRDLVQNSTEFERHGSEPLSGNNQTELEDGNSTKKEMFKERPKDIVFEEKASTKKSKGSNGNVIAEAEVQKKILPNKKSDDKQDIKIGSDKIKDNEKGLETTEKNDEVAADRDDNEYIEESGEEGKMKEADESIPSGFEKQKVPVRERDVLSMDATSNAARPTLVNDLQKVRGVFRTADKKSMIEIVLVDAYECQIVQYENANASEIWRIEQRGSNYFVNQIGAGKNLDYKVVQEIPLTIQIETLDGSEIYTWSWDEDCNELVFVSAINGAVYNKSYLRK